MFFQKSCVFSLYGASPAYAPRLSSHCTATKLALILSALVYTLDLLPYQPVLYRISFDPSRVRHTFPVKSSDMFALYWVRLWDRCESKTLPKSRGGGGVLGLSFAGYVPLASQSPCPIIVYFVASCRPHLRHFLGKCNFRDPN